MATSVGQVFAEFSIKGIQDALTQLQNVAKQIDALNGKKINIDVGLGGSSGGVSGATNQIASLTKSLEGLSKAGAAPAQIMNSLSNVVLGVGRSMEHVGQIGAIFGYRMALIAAPLAALGVEGSKAAIDLEASVAKAATQLDNLSPDNVKKFTTETTAELRKLSTEFPKTAKDMADAVYYIISTMTIDPAIAKKMIEPISGFATAINSTVLDASKAVAPILNVYKDYAQSADTVNKALAVMNETIRRGKGEGADIARQFGDFLAQGKTLGLSLAEQSAIFAQVSRVAGSPSEASTQVSALFRALSTPKTADELEKVGIKISEAVEGTGQWTNSVGALDAASQKAYQSIINKLQGAEGVTGLYGQLNKAQVDLQRNETDYNAKKSTANARQLDDSRQKVQTLQQEIAYWEAKKAELTGGEGSLTYTGQMQYRNVFDILRDVDAYLSTFKSEQAANEALRKILPNVRATRGAQTLFLPGQLDETQSWAAQMESPEAQQRLAQAVDTMGNTIESRLEKVKNTLNASLGDLYDKFIKEKLINLLGYVTQLIDAFNKASPELKEFIIQFVVLASALGPASLVFGTLMIGLSQLFAVVGLLLSPAGIIGLSAALVFLKGPLTSLKQGVDDAGGGFKGLATFAAEVAVALGLVTQTDATKFLKDMGLYADGINLGKVREDAQKLAGQIKDVIATLSDWLDKLKAIAQFISDNYETLGLVVAAGMVVSSVATALSWLAKLEAAFVTLKAASAAAAGAEGLAGVGAAASALPAVVTVTLVLLGVGAMLAGLGAVEAQINAMTGRKPFGQEEYEHWTAQNPPFGNAEAQNYGVYGGYSSVAGGGTGDMTSPYYYGTPNTAFGGDMTSPYYYGSGAFGAADWEEIYGTGGVAAAAAGARNGLVKPKSTTTPPGAGGIGGMGGGPIPIGHTVTPQEAAPGIFRQFAGEGWMSAFAQQHGGQDAYSYYAGQGYTDPIGAALRDKAWGDSFAKEHGGKGPEKGDWEAHWYETYGKTEVDELDAEGKPTGKKKTVIDKKGPVDEFTKMVADAMKGLTDKKTDITKAYTDPPQALIDRKPEITKAYTDPVDAFVEAAKNAIAAINAMTGKGNNKTTTTDTTTTAPPAPPGDSTHGAYDFGGPVISSGAYRLLRGEYVVSMPEQRDIRAIMRGVTNNRGGDAFNINVNGANADPKAIAAAVMAEIRWQKGRTSGKLVY